MCTLNIPAMRNLIVMFVTAVCFRFLLKLKWPKNKNSYIVNLYRGMAKLSSK